jgi:Outer membrane protein beta-barrel domain
LSVRTRWAVAVVLAATAASVSNAFAQPKPGQGSLGARIGVPYFTGDKDTKDAQRPRLLFLANFGYRFSPGWRLNTDFGYGWIGYKDEAPTPYKVVTSSDSVMVKQDLLTKFVPIDVTLIKALNPDAKKWSPYVGAGATITRLEIVNQRRKIQDPATFVNWIKWAPGVHAMVGSEYFIPAKPTVSLDFSLRWTYLFSKDTKRFPSGFTGNDSYLTGNFGVNVHFWPGGNPIETAEEPVPEPLPDPLAPATPAPPDTMPAPVPTPTPPDTSVAPPDTSLAPPDTTQRAPVSHARVESVLLRDAAAPASVPAPADEPDEATFGAFGVTIPKTEDEGAACEVEIKEKRNLR